MSSDYPREPGKDGQIIVVRGGECVWEYPPSPCQGESEEPQVMNFQPVTVRQPDHQTTTEE